MSATNACDLKTGVWTPKNEIGGRQLQTSTITSKQRNQLQSGAFSSDEISAIRAAITRKYAAVSSSAEGYFKYTVGKTGALTLGYPQELLDEIPEALLNSFCGVGNPLAIENIPTGSCILDIGCGAGFDLFAASQVTGATGSVCGIDLTREMVTRARANLAALQVKNCEVFEASSERLPFSDHTFDIVISNGVINLSPDKPQLFAEIHRVLKPGGRLQFADIILDNELPPHLAVGAESWSQWIGGAIPGRDQIILMEKAGFVEIAARGETSVRTSSYTVGALFRAQKKG